MLASCRCNPFSLQAYAQKTTFPTCFGSFVVVAQFAHKLLLWSPTLPDCFGVRNIDARGQWENRTPLPRQVDWDKNFFKKVVWPGAVLMTVERQGVPSSDGVVGARSGPGE